MGEGDKLRLFWTQDPPRYHLIMEWKKSLGIAAKALDFCPQIYEDAVKYAQNLAKGLKCDFVDESRQKESPLAESLHRSSGCSGTG